MTGDSNINTHYGHIQNCVQFPVNFMKLLMWFPCKLAFQYINEGNSRNIFGSALIHKNI